MSKNFAVAFVIGLVCIAIAIGGIFYMQRGAHIDAHGKFLKVRTAPLDDNDSLAVIDFRIENPADYGFKVRSVTVVMEDAAGNPVEGQTASDSAAKQAIEGIPSLGQKFNDSLIMNDMVPPKGTWDRMIAASFNLPEAKLQARKRFVLKIEEVDGKIAEIAEK
ncbi:MAG TPA: hypothetical protein VG456_23365 [Candidatus Sulfopaludibacter sp.]|nr:hypothetical protein [Candidatus Sulfopaludibacter sp.]